MPTENNTYTTALTAYLRQDFNGKSAGRNAITNPYLRDSHLRITKVIFNGPATIVYWSDGSKTVVRCSEGDTFDPEKGLAMAIAKKAFGNEGNYYNEIKKWLPND